ncbi:MAG: ABC transporter permease [Burkholderiaceae bacterium]
MLALLQTFSLQELRQHPWRHVAALVAVTLGVALAFAVHVINASALDEFSGAVRSVGGQPDLELRAVQGGLDEAVYGFVAQHPQVALASPVLELATYAVLPGATPPRQPLRVLGVDALRVAALAPALLPQPAAGADRLALFAPGVVFLNAAAQQLWPKAAASSAASTATLAAPASGAAVTAARSTLQLQSGLALRSVTVGGSVAAGGAPLAVMDIGAAQEFFGKQGQLTRIDLRLQAGVNAQTFAERLLRTPGWPGNITAVQPGDAQARISNLSRAYRVNLTVLALVALFTGAFLVFSVLSLSVARRAAQFALLGVLGLTPGQRLQLVLAESLALGLLGSAVGVALGTALAWAALTLLGGDLGGGYFSGVAPALQWDPWAALAYGLLGTLAALVGGFWPARAAQHYPLAATLKGLGTVQAATSRSGGRAARPWGLLLLAAGALLALAPPILGLPLAAYAAIALMLLGGITALPGLIALLYDRLAPRLAAQLLPLLAVERARRVRHTAAVAVSGVVASLALSVALTVMVGSFRGSVTQWLEVVLPADLYVRTASAPGTSEAVFLPPAFVAAAAAVPGVARLQTLRSTPLLLKPALPPVVLIARPLGDASRSLPLVGALYPVPPGQVGIYVSEAVLDLYGVVPGEAFSLFSASFRPLAKVNTAGNATDSVVPAVPIAAQTFFVAGVWRDYSRQFGAIVMDQRDFQRLTGDTRVNDLALWLTPQAQAGAVQQALRALAEKDQAAAGTLLEFAGAQDIRALSLKIFDRSFAVTYWLQAVAIGMGLFGVAASFSAQVLARRKEFGLLAHLGFTRRQILALVAGEGAAWTLVGALAGLVLGLAVSVVLVHVVNPQSFHWTMDLAVPWLRLLALCAAVLAAGVATAWLAGRAAAGRDAVLAVKEDW